jgi:putative ABC transport system permease protein
VLGSLGVGALLVFIGVALFAATLVRPLALALGWPAKTIGGVAGELAQDNTQRNPQRTASTAAALMIGLALVTLVAMLANGLIAPFRDAVRAINASDYAITGHNVFVPIPAAAGKAAVSAEGVTASASVRGGSARAFDESIFVTATDPTAAKVLKLDWEEGSQATFAALGQDGAFVDTGYAKSHDLALGSPISLTTPQGTMIRLRVKGIFKPPTGGSPFGEVTFASAVFDASYEHPRDLYTFIDMRDGVSDSSERALKDALAAFPNATVRSSDAFTDAMIKPIKMILNILFVLLALSVVGSLFGILNALFLTVFERTRELGMLRAVGMTRRQTRRMIRHESIITALIGAVLGILLGIGFGGLLAARVEFIDFAPPLLQLLVFFVAAIGVGILAAIFPARRAANLNPLEALQYE